MRVIDTEAVRIILKSSANNLMNKKQLINDLNVFPVPDGDTGTNMSLTFCNAVNMLKLDELNTPSEIFSSLAKSALRCARGNSGVILSQIIRGFSKGIEGNQTELDCVYIAKGINEAKETAYRAVMKATEGTILTVIREMAEFALASSENYDDAALFAADILKHGNESLKKTQDMLETLKRAGVVDAGGAGLMAIVEGAVYAIQNGNEIKSEVTQETATVIVGDEPKEIRFAYCTEFLINKSSADRSVNSFKAAISPKGDCMLVIDDDEIVKVHIHTNHPGFVIEEALKLGELTNLKIDNMRYQHNEIINGAENSEEVQTTGKTEEDDEISNENNVQRSKYGIVAVAAGEGFKQIFKELGVSEIVEGGQTMNPSTEDLFDAVKRVNADTVFILPNNKNIIMAAEQVKNIADCRTEVIPSRNIASGISAVMGFDDGGTVEENIEAMTEMMQDVRYGQITTAVRDVELKNVSVKCGDIIGISNDEILIVGNDINDTTAEFIEKNINEYTSSVTIYYGADIEKETAEKLIAKLEEKYPSLDIILGFGGQPVYYYGISME